MKKLLITLSLLLPLLASAKMGSYDLRCSVVSGCQYSDSAELGYCVTRIRLTKDGATIGREDLITERKLLSLRFENVFEEVVDNEITSIIATDEVDYSDTEIYLGENSLSVQPVDGSKYTYEGNLSLEEDFGFELICTDFSFGGE